MLNNAPNQNDWMIKEEPQKFLITEKEYKDFVDRYLDVAIENDALRKKMKKSFKGFELRTWPDKHSPNGRPDPIGEVSQYPPRGPVKKINKWAYIGEKRPDGKIVTDFEVLKVGLHELAHSVSAKHDLDKIKAYEKKVEQTRKANKGSLQGVDIKPFEIDHTTGETESIFSELLFNQVLFNSLDKLKGKKPTLFGLNDEQVIKEAGVLKRNDFREFGHKMQLVHHCSKRLDDLHHFADSLAPGDELNKVKNEIQRTKADAEYWTRYAVGYASASLLESQYIDCVSNGEKTDGVINKLANFLENGNKMTKDEIVSSFTDGRVVSFNDLREDFIKDSQNKIKQIQDGSFGIFTKISPLSKQELDAEKENLESSHPDEHIYTETKKQYNSKTLEEQERQND